MEEGRHEELLRPGTVHLLADDLLDLVQHAGTDREELVDPAPTMRAYPARSMRTCDGIVASLGTSLTVGMNAREYRIAPS